MVPVFSCQRQYLDKNYTLKRALFTQDFYSHSKFFHSLPSKKRVSKTALTRLGPGHVEAREALRAEALLGFEHMQVRRLIWWFSDFLAVPESIWINIEKWCATKIVHHTFHQKKMIHTACIYPYIWYHLWVPDRESPWVHPRGQVPLFANKSGEGADRTMGRKTRTVWQFSRNKLFGSSSLWCFFVVRVGGCFLRVSFSFLGPFREFAQIRSPPLDGLKELESHCRSQERNSTANTKGMKQHDKHVATKSVRFFLLWKLGNIIQSFQVNWKKRLYEWKSLVLGGLSHPQLKRLATELYSKAERFSGMS